jgi:hypothetical protein
MQIQDVDRLREDRDEAQIALEQGCRETFLPGMKVAYPRGGKLVTVEVLRSDDEDDYLCWVRNPKTGSEYRIKYEEITEIV